MSNDIGIATASSSSVGNGAAGSVRSPATPPASVAAAATAVPPASNPTPNPTLQLNAALGLVVIQFHNNSGAVTRSIPSQQQINAYRLWEESKIGPPPSLGGAVVPGAATRVNA